MKAHIPGQAPINLSKPEHMTQEEYFDPATFQPTHDNVLIEVEMQKDGLIATPDAYRKIKRKCRVIAVGPGRWFPPGANLRPAPCRVNDLVFVVPDMVLKLEFNGKVYGFVGSEDILGVFPPDTGDIKVDATDPFLEAAKS